MSKINDSLFILPGQNISDESHDSADLSIIVKLKKEDLCDRWESEYGKNIISKWEASEYRRDVIDSLVGKYYNHTDLRGIPLSNSKIYKQDLSSIDFFGSCLKETVLDRVNMTDSWLSGSNLKGTKIRWSKMDNALVDNIDFDTQTEFQGIDLNKINFTLASLVHDLAVSQQRIDHLKIRHPYISKFLWATSDYGRSIGRWLICVTAIILSFSLFYWLSPGAISQSGFLNSCYFSFVTFTTLGYGDILPLSSLSKCIVILEVGIGYLMGGLLVAILAKKVIGN